MKTINSEENSPPRKRLILLFLFSLVYFNHGSATLSNFRQFRSPEITLFAGRTRIVVENTLAELKHFKVLADRFRHNLDIYDDTFRSVVALVNPRIARRVIATI